MYVASNPTNDETVAGQFGESENANPQDDKNIKWWRVGLWWFLG